MDSSENITTLLRSRGWPTWRPESSSVPQPPQQLSPDEADEYSAMTQSLNGSLLTLLRDREADWSLRRAGLVQLRQFMQQDFAFNQDSLSLWLRFKEPLAVQGNHSRFFMFDFFSRKKFCGAQFVEHNLLQTRGITWPDLLAFTANVPTKVCV